MANSSYSPNGEQGMNLKEELGRALERELQKNRRVRTTELANAASSSCTSPSMMVPTPLLKLLVECCSLTSPRNKGSIPPSGTSRGLSPAPSISSDSSVSCGLNFTTTERSNPTTMGLHRSARGIAQERPVPTPNSPMSPSAPNPVRGRSAVSASTTVASVVGRAPASTSVARVAGRAPAKVPKKRKRKSKKPPTTTKYATVGEFRATVQELTGCKELPAPVIRPQPQPAQPDRRPQASAVPMDVDLDSRGAPARPDSSLTSMISPVHFSAPTVTSDRAPPATFAIHDSATCGSSLSKSSGLNYCMGFDQVATPPFLKNQLKDYDENLGQLQDNSSHHPAPDSVYRHTSEPVQYNRQEDNTTPASSTGASFHDAASLDLPSESEGKEGTPEEQMYSGSGGNHDIRSGSHFSLSFTNQPPVYGLSHHHLDPDRFEWDEYDPDWTSGGFILADSFLNCQ